MTPREVLTKCMRKPQEMQALMRKHNLKIDNLDDPMQKLAFTFYTELCELSHDAAHALEEEPCPSPTTPWPS